MIQGFKIQRFKDSKIQGFKDSKIQRFKDSKIQGFKDSGMLIVGCLSTKRQTPNWSCQTVFYPLHVSAKLPNIVAVS